MDATEERRRGFVAEAQRFFDCINQVEAATWSIFILLLLMSPRQGLGSTLTAVGGFGTVAVFTVAIVRWIRGATTNWRRRLQKIVESVLRSSASCAGAELPSHGLQIRYAARRVAII